MLHLYTFCTSNYCPYGILLFTSITGFTSNMISNNGIQSTKKILKMIQYFKNKSLPPRILFLQETHSTESKEAIWRDEFDATLFFLLWLFNSCGVLIGFLGQFDVNVLNQMSENKDLP